MSLMQKTRQWVLFGTLLMVAVGARAECTSGNGGNELVSTLLGAAIGGLIGSQVGSGSGNKVAIGAGVLAGGLLGSKVARSMNCEDQGLHNNAAQDALETKPSGTTSSWRNPDSGSSGAITPMRTYQQQDGSYCRDFEQTILVDGKAEQAYGEACRQEDGSWRIVERPGRIYSPTD